MGAMRVALVDVGSNTARLLVADVDGSIDAVREEKAYLALGGELVRLGRLTKRKVAEAGSVARRFARLARRLHAERLETVVTAPGRQSSAEPLLRELGRATQGPVRVLSAEEEGRLAYLGALARETQVLPDVVAVCDVGGGSTEIAAGTPLLGPAWVRSADLGSLRLTRSCLHADPPTADEVEAARRLVRAALAPLSPPRPELALAVGGSARAAAKVVGRTLGPDDLEYVASLCASRRSAKVARTFGLDYPRAETLLSGALLLAEASRLLGVPFRLGHGGLREGAALALAARSEAAAA